MVTGGNYESPASLLLSSSGVLELFATQSTGDNAGEVDHWRFQS